MCASCWQNILQQRTQVCPWCYMPSKQGEMCLGCRLKYPYYFLDGLLAASSFAENLLLQKAIHAFKYDFIRDLGEPLAKLLLPLITFPRESIVLCPVPLHEKRLQWRGFNQAELLAYYLSKKTGICQQQLLARRHFKRPQMELSREERLTNMKNAFRFCGDGTTSLPTTVLLIDDVATTMTTLQACAAALKAGGIKKVYAIVLARVY